MTVGAGPAPDRPAGRVVRVVPDVAGIDKVFDYVVPDELDGDVRVGTVVRVPLHGRRVGAWVVEVDVDPPAGVELKAVAKVTGWGPTAELVDLSTWAGWRWAGRRRAFLRSATAPGAVDSPSASRRAQSPAWPSSSRKITSLSAGHWSRTMPSICT